jgi:hypothetical protein
MRPSGVTAPGCLGGGLFTSVGSPPAGVAWSEFGCFGAPAGADGCWPAKTIGNRAHRQDHKKREPKVAFTVPTPVRKRRRQGVYRLRNWGSVSVTAGSVSIHFVVSGGSGIWFAVHEFAASATLSGNLPSRTLLKPARAISLAPLSLRAEGFRPTKRYSFA